MSLGFRLYSFLSLVLWLTCGSLPGQNRTPGRIVSAGYAAPAPIKVAPGQVITLFLHAADGTQPTKSEVASGSPLPAVLNGYSVSMDQTFGTGPQAVPLFAVYPLDNCSGLSPSACEDLVAITVQIPWELFPNRGRSGRPENFAVLTVSFQGTRGESFAIDPTTDSIHVINTCDSTLPPGLPTDTEFAESCRPLVTHSDGSLVTPANPAVSGERLDLYAFGLGEPGGLVQTGDTTRSPVSISDVAINVLAGINLAPVRPVATPQPPGNAPIPIFAGLAGGQIGLYQISFQAPILPNDAKSCTASSIASNATVSIGRINSFDGAGICVGK